jgi:hypothetical protein
LNDIRHAYLEIVRQGVTAFRQVPTIMPHFAGHQGAASLAARMLLKPINCCPSLHTAVPFFAYNLVASHLPEKEAELRRHVGDIVSTVISTKLHALIDIAFGMILVQKILEDNIGLNFLTLESFFLQEQKGKDNIPYEHIYRMYREINELAKTKGNKGLNLPEIMEGYFQEIGLPRVKREKSNCLYDLEQRALAYPPDLKVGSGLL